MSPKKLQRKVSKLSLFNFVNYFEEDIFYFSALIGIKQKWSNKNYKLD